MPGIVRGGQSPKRRALLQSGNLVAAQLAAAGNTSAGISAAFDIELVRAHAAGVIDDADRLAALTSAAALIALALPEREPAWRRLPSLRRAHRSARSSAPTGRQRYVAWECNAADGPGLRARPVAPVPPPGSTTTSPTSRRVRAASVSRLGGRALPGEAAAAARFFVARRSRGRCRARRRSHPDRLFSAPPSARAAGSGPCPRRRPCPAGRPPAPLTGLRAGWYDLGVNQNKGPDTMADPVLVGGITRRRLRRRARRARYLS